MKFKIFLIILYSVKNFHKKKTNHRHLVNLPKRRARTYKFNVVIQYIYIPFLRF